MKLSWFRRLFPALIVLGVLSPTLFFPYGRDQGVFAYVGAAIGRGELPYRDVWDLKPPGIYLLYALLTRGVGEAGEPLMLALRLADLAVAAGVGTLLAALARRLAHPSDDAGAVEAVGWASAGWYAILYLQGTFWSMAQAEAWANLLVLGAALLTLRPPARGQLALAFCAGLLVGGAAVLKFTTVGLILPCLWAATRRERGWKPGEWAAGAAGGLLPLLAVAGWMHATGIWDDYVDIQRGFVAPYTRLNAASIWTRITNLFGYGIPWLGQVWLPASLALAGASVARGWSPLGRRLLLGMLAMGLLAVWVQNKYFGYHWQTVLPALALLAAAGTLAVARRLDPARTHLARIGLAFVVGWCLVTSGAYYRDAALLAVGQLPREAWLARFGPPNQGDYSFLGARWAAEYVRSHTRPQERILVWGFEPAVYLLSDRRAPTRFFFNVPVAAPFAPEAWRREFLTALEDRPPALVLVLRGDRIPHASGRRDDSTTQLRDWPELEHWLLSNYRKARVIEDFTIYERAER